MSDGPIRRLLRALIRFRKDAGFGQPGMCEVSGALTTLERTLESVQIDTANRLRGRQSMLRSANQLGRHIYYQNIKIRTQNQELQQLRGVHNRFLTSFWTAHAGLSGPRSNQRSVESWCQDIS